MAGGRHSRSLQGRSLQGRSLQGQSLHGPSLQRLRAQIAGIEPKGRRPEAGPCRASPLALLDGALHEVRAADWRDRPAGLAFCLALAGARAEKTGAAILLLSLAHEARETGALFARGLPLWGVDPGAVVAAFARDAKMLLWAAEEAAKSAGLAAVLVEAPPSRLLDLTGTRRLHLAAEGSRGAVVLIRTMREPAPTAAAMRWLVAPLPSAPAPFDDRAPGRPRFHVALERRRGGGGLQTWDVEWDDETRTFVDAGQALPQPLPAALAGRPPRAAHARSA